MKKETILSVTSIVIFLVISFIVYLCFQVQYHAAMTQSTHESLTLWTTDTIFYRWITDKESCILNCILIISSGCILVLSNLFTTSNIKLLTRIIGFLFIVCLFSLILLLIKDLGSSFPNFR